MFRRKLFLIYIVNDIQYIALKIENKTNELIVLSANLSLDERDFFETYIGFVA